MPTAPTEWFPDLAFIKRIHTAHRHTRLFKREQRQWAEYLLQTHYNVPQKAAPSIIRLALKASVRTIRRTHFNAGLIRRMILDQVVVYYHQTRQIRDEHTRLYYKLARNRAVDYANLHFPAQPGVWQDDVEQKDSLTDEAWSNFYQYAHEELASEAVLAFFNQIARPGFVLTKSLESYLNQIVRNMFFDLVKSYKDLKPIHAPPLPVRAAELAHDLIRYRQQAHRLIDNEFRALYSKCQELLRRFYRIDLERANRASSLSDQTEPLTEAEFRQLFAVGMAPTREVTSLTVLAPELGISTKKISDWHIDCLDELVLNVIPALFADEALSIPPGERIKLENRLRLAQLRWQSKRKTSQF